MYTVYVLDERRRWRKVDEDFVENFDGNSDENFKENFDENVPS